MDVIKFWNTKTRGYEKFVPIKEGKVSMYSCGPTVYDFTHIGHMRRYIGDDVLKRTLGYFGYEVNHVMNITDVGHLSDDGDEGEDKMEKGALKYGKTVWEVAEFYTEYFEKTMKALDVLTPSHFIKATDHIDGMIAFVKHLEEKGFTYETPQAIYFDTTKFKEYGALSGQKIEDKKQAVREDVVVDKNKKHPADFVLWFKRVGRFAHHTMHWESKWGDGFPGWHIECSAMSMEYLGETIDIHTGGVDHIPVHHENEIAQSECATGHEFVHFWIHHNFLQVEGEKMSKSKGNYYTIDDIVEKGINPLALRFLFLQAHYRKAMNFTFESLKGAENAYDRLIDIFSNLKESEAKADFDYIGRFKRALGDDLDTPGVIALMWELLHDMRLDSEIKRATVLEFDKVLGLGLDKIEKDIAPKEVLDLLEKRQIARNSKNWQESDEIRHQIALLGWEVLDSKDDQKISRFRP